MSSIPTHNFNTTGMNRIKPTLLRDVKTEALLVFARTALERYFQELDSANVTATDVDSTNEIDEDASYVYKTLQKFLIQLQDSVVNADYLIHLAKNAPHNPGIRFLLKKEEPLMNYYDVMAQHVRSHYHSAPVYLPVFLVINVLSEWVLEEEKSVHLYPFLHDIDFLELIGKFEGKREYYYEDDTCKLSEVYDLASQIIAKLKKYKYKANKQRVSKTRRKSR